MTRVAMVANWWYRRGGLGGVMLDEAAWLGERGYEIVPFAAAHPANLPAESSRFFPPFVETSLLGTALPPIARLGAAKTIIHNAEAARAFGEFVKWFRPDVVHLHGPARQLSPSVLGIARAAGLPIVMTLHDYGLVCPQGLMLKAGDRPCTAPNCVRGDLLNAVRYRCVKGSRAGSALGMVEQLVHRSLGWYRDRVDVFIAPSRFLLGLVGSSGAVRPGRIRWLPNGLVTGTVPDEVPATGGHVLFSGRLVAEKGLDILIAAARRVPEIPIVIAGDGGLREDLERRAPSNVSFVGHRTAAELDDLRADAVAVTSPSTWYENAPLAVLEAMRAGRAVIATDIGGQSELLSGGGGLLVPPGDAVALADSIGLLWRDRVSARGHGSAGREQFLRSYTAERHVDGLEAVYREAIALAADGGGQRRLRAGAST